MQTMNKQIDDAIDAVIQKEPLFTSLVKRLNIVEDKNCPTLGTDGEILEYNPDFIKQISQDELSGTILHETLHSTFRHVWRRGKREPIRFNAACDLAINGMVLESFPLPKGALVDSKYFGMSAEEIYDQLPPTKVIQIQAWCEKNEWEGQSKKSGQSGIGKKKSEEKGEGIGDKIKDLLGKNGDKDKQTPSGTEKQKQLDWEWKDAFDKTIMQDYGTMPESMRRVVKKTFYNPTIDWTSLVMSLLIEDITDYSFSVPDRRFLEQDFILPDLYSYDRLKDVVFGYDTSGSISEYDLFSFYMETLALFENFNSLTGWIAICDAELHSFDEINTREKSKFDFRGGGGTSFIPVFEEIERRGLRPKALFYFTDTFGSFPTKYPGYPVFWLVRRDLASGWGEPDVPFGKVIKFSPKRTIYNDP